MQYNISPETLTHEKISCTVDRLLDQEIDTTYAKRRDLSMTANGWCYRRDIKGFMPELMETMYANRSKFKKQMLKVQQEYELDKSKKHLLKEISRLNNLQMAMKLSPRDPWNGLFYARTAEAHFALGNLEQAVDFGRKAANTAKPRIFMITPIIATLGSLGRCIEAEPFIQQLKEIRSDVTLEFVEKRQPVCSSDLKERFIAGLRKAGIPE